MILSYKPLLLLFSLISVTYTASAPASYSQTDYFRSGTFQPVSTLKSASDVISNFPITFTSPLVSSLKNNVLICLSSFDCLASNQFSFNISVVSYDLVGFTGKVEIIGNTYFNLIKVNYLGLSWNTPPLQTQFMYRDCFLTTFLSTGTGDRSMPFAKQSFTSNITDGSKFLVQSFITGLKFLNNKDIFKKVQVQTEIVSGTNYLNHTVSVNGNTQLQWACIGTIILETTFSAFTNQVSIYRIGSFNIIRVPQDIDIASFPTGYLPIFDQDDNKFFGITSLELYLGKPYQILNVKTENQLTVQVGYQGMATAGKMSYIFIALRQCNNASLPKYSQVDKLCYDFCPTAAAQYQSSGVCYSCHYSCYTCSNAGNNSCLTCLNSTNRVFNNGSCDCMSGFVQDGVAICPPCSNFISGCAICTNKTVCTNCTGVFVFNNITNSSNPTCECPIGTFYVALNNTCATFPGCDVANIQTNFIYCYSCNSTQHFYLDDNTRGNTYTCKCEQYYTLSGSTCLDLCGDGVNTNGNSTTYCDDGNTNSSDGCSSNCTVEFMYGCFNPPYVNRSFCSPQRTYDLKYLYAQRIVDQNSGYFLFQVSPPDPRLAEAGFTYYVESTMPHSRATGIYDPSTSILKIKVQYLKTIQDQTHTLKITFDPYKMTVSQKLFTFTSSGVNFDLTYDQSPKLNSFAFYGIAVISGLIVMAALVFSFTNYKIASVQLLLSAQIVYLGVIASNEDNLSIYPLSNLKFLVGFNQIKQFQISKYNYNTPFLISSYTYAQFLLNFNYMAALLALVILIVLPLKLNVAYKFYRRNKYTSPQMQQKLMQQENNLSLKQLSSDIKSAQFYADTYIDRVYFGFSLIVFMPIVVFFAIQLGFIGKIGRYELNAFGNIILSILLLMVDFCFFILVFQDTDRKLKTFNFGSKKLKSYPYRLMMFYFISSCIFTIVLLSNLTFYVLFGLNLLIGLYVVIENPYDKWTLQYFDAISKPLISLVSLGIIKSISFFSSQMIFLPISIFVLLLISLITTIIRVVRVKLNRADIAKKILQDSGQVQDDVQFDKNLKQTDRSQFNSEKSKKQGKNSKNSQKDNKLEQTDQQKGKNNGGNNFNLNQNNNQNQQSGQDLIKKDNNLDQNDELPEDDQDQLAKIKRSLRQDLKKRRGVINKVNDDGTIVKQKKPKKPKKSKHTAQNDNNYQFI